MATSTAERRAKRAVQNPPAITGPKAGIANLDEDLADFILTQVSGGRWRLKTSSVADRILDGELELTMEGASTLTVTVHDPDSEVLLSGVLTRAGKPQTKRFRSLRAEVRSYARLAAVDVEVDGVWFRLVDVNPDGDQLHLTFEDRDVAYLRQHSRIERASRAHVTRAEFVHSLVRKVKLGGGIKFSAPDEHKKQRIAKPSKADSAAGKDPGFSPGATITVKGKPATAAQKRVVGDVLDVGSSMGATERVLVTAGMVITQESAASNSATNGPHVGAFGQDNRAGSSWRKAGGASRDARKDAAAFFKKAIATNNANSGLSLAQLAEKVQASGQGSLYAQWQAEATKTVKAFTGGSDSGDFGTSTRTYGKSYQYTVGQPGQKETYWDAIQRLADEVRWRAFIDRGTLWFVSDETLMRQQPAMTIRRPRAGASDRDTLGVDGIDFDWDSSQATYFHEATVQARLGRWQAMPGMLVEVVDSGTADGRWLVWTVTRSLFDTAATVTLRRPDNPKAEPATELVTQSTDLGSVTSGSSGSLGDSKVAKAVSEAVSISNQNLPYVWGGGHSQLGVPNGGGFDCSGYVSAVLGAAGLGVTAPLTSGGLMSWGEPGPGKYLTVYASPVHVFIKVTIPGVNITYIDTSRQAGGPAGPHVRTGERSTAGFSARHWSGT